MEQEKKKLNGRKNRGNYHFYIGASSNGEGHTVPSTGHTRGIEREGGWKWKNAGGWLVEAGNKNC